MTKEINLIASRERKLFSFYEDIKVLKKAILGLNILVVFLMGIFLSIYLTSTYQLKTNESKINALKKEINNLNKKETYLVMLSDRLKEIDKILKIRTSQEELIKKIKELFVPGFVFSDLSISGNRKSKIIGACSDYLCLSQLNAKAEELKESDPFSEFIFGGVSQRINEPFEIDITLTD